MIDSNALSVTVDLFSPTNHLDRLSSLSMFLPESPYTTQTLFVHITRSSSTRTAWTILSIVGSCVLLPLLIFAFILLWRVPVTVCPCRRNIDDADIQTHVHRHRHVTVVNLCLSFCLSGCLSLLLCFTGHSRGAEPPKGLCIAQAALMGGTTPSCIVAILVLVYYVRTLLDQDQWGRTKTFFLIALPHLVGAVFSLAALLLSVHIPGSVSRKPRFFYCSLEYPVFSYVVLGFTVLVSFVTIVFEAIVFLCSRSPIIPRSLSLLVFLTLERAPGVLQKTGSSNHVHVKLAVRMVIFVMFTWCGVVLDCIQVFYPTTLAPDMFDAALPLALFLIFGSQRDIVHIYLCILRMPLTIAYKWFSGDAKPSHNSSETASADTAGADGVTSGPGEGLLPYLTLRQKAEYAYAHSGDLEKGHDLGSESDDGEETEMLDVRHIPAHRILAGVMDIGKHDSSAVKKPGLVHAASALDTVAPEAVRGTDPSYSGFSAIHSRSHALRMPMSSLERVHLPRKHRLANI